MHIERIHKMIEKLTECALCELDKGAECVNTKEFGEVVDMIKDLSEAEYKSLISKEMKEYKEEEEAEEKYMMRKLKEDYKDEYKRMKDEYGEDEGERRFYDNYRYKTTGRFAPKGRGSYMPRSSGRRGYEEPPYYHMTPEMMREHDPEYWRDMDRMDGKMYYTPMGGSNSGNMSMGHSGGSSRGYSDGYNDGNRRGYEDGYRDGRSNNQRDGKEGRSGQSRRTYMETKEMNRGNTPQEKQEKMKSLESYMKELSEDLTEMIEDASNEERSMLKAKLATLSQKIS